MKVKIQVSFINEIKWTEDIDFQSAESMAAWIDYRATEGWGYSPIFHSEAAAGEFGFEEMADGSWVWFQPMRDDRGRICGEYPALEAMIEELAERVAKAPRRPQDASKVSRGVMVLLEQRRRLLEAKK